MILNLLVFLYTIVIVIFHFHITNVLPILTLYVTSYIPMTTALSISTCDLYTDIPNVCINLTRMVCGFVT